MSADKISADRTWDAGALGCGELIAQLLRQVKELTPRQTLHVVATDPGAPEDIPAWCRVTGNTLRIAEPPHYVIERKDT